MNLFEVAHSVLERTIFTSMLELFQLKNRVTLSSILTFMSNPNLIDENLNYFYVAFLLLRSKNYRTR